jgi:hypothetical protein
MKPESKSEIVVYQTEDGRTLVECRFDQENVWLAQAVMAELFPISVPTVNEHLKGIFAEGELEPDATTRKFRMVRSEGSRQGRQPSKHHSLEMHLAVGRSAKLDVDARPRRHSLAA